jgi:hypothetical protein
MNIDSNLMGSVEERNDKKLISYKLVCCQFLQTNMIKWHVFLKHVREVPANRLDCMSTML